jgi:hypothetical protein
MELLTAKEELDPEPEHENADPNPDPYSQHPLSPPQKK